ncbi:carbohydrate kinase [Kitasatospora paracochleata]|uniref:Fructokinase n=1 Tax=Kitasatospora paracochleata TaxID=58354 RepID=A0ABT1J4S4_9ACTN|nr:carbohydrate kinase [Kitasatospora paracochleata]MCP2312118.1 fructokinase [Kitasatospora paracochleata]
MTLRRITVLGECVADAFTDHHRETRGGLTLRVHPGGGPANTAVALARLGTPTRFLGRLSTDVFGRLFREHLTASGVDVSGCVTAAEPSTLAVADLDGQGRAEYSFHASGTADWQWTPAELAQEPAGDPCAVHTGSLALVRPPGGTVVEDFLARAAERATVSIDPNVRTLLVDPTAYRARLEHWCELADLLRLSEDDLAELLPGTPPEAACRRWHTAGVPLVVVTLGARGALLSLHGEQVTVPAPPVTIADTVGAGDAFTAGLLHHLAGQGLLGGRLNHLDLPHLTAAAHFATHVAALTCAAPGADPPWAHQL